MTGSLHLIVILVLRTPSARAPAATPLRLLTTARTARSLARRRANKRKVDADRLLEQLLSVCALNGRPSLREGRVLDEDVSLRALSCQPCSWTSNKLAPRLSSRHRSARTHLHITGPAIQIEVQVLDLPILPKQILYVFLGSFLMHIGDDDDPAFYAAYRDRVLSSLRLSV